MKIKNGDNVRVMVGKDKGKTGKVLQVFPDMQKVVIENVNKAYKHIKKRGENAGQRVEFFAPVHISNLRVVGKEKEGRVGYKFLEVDGKKKKVRFIKGKDGVEDLT